MKRVMSVAAVLLLAVAAGLFLRHFVVGFTRVAGDSMNDTLQTGDVVLVSRLDYIFGAPDRFDVAQLDLPGRDGTYLKRVIGLPGEKVEIIGGVVHINGEAIEENYAAASNDDYSIVLGDDEYFVLGDNRPVSYDSREEEIGAVSADCFRGRVRAVVWPFDRFDLCID